MPRKKEPEDEGQPRTIQRAKRAPDDDVGACFVCTLARNEEGEPLRRRLARALAHGSLVLGKGGALATCPNCHERIEDETRELGRELRALRAAARERG